MKRIIAIGILTFAFLCLGSTGEELPLAANQWEFTGTGALLEHGMEITGPGTATLRRVPICPGRKYCLEYSARSRRLPSTILPYHTIQTTVIPTVENSFAFDDLAGEPQQKKHVFRIPATAEFETVDLVWKVTSDGAVEFSAFTLTEVPENDAEELQRQWRLSLTQPYYRNTIFAGDQYEELRGEIQSDPTCAVAELRLENEHGTLATATVTLPNGSGDFTLPIGEVEVGTLHLVCELFGADSESRGVLTESIYRLPPAPMEVKVLPNRYLSINGEAFFPVMEWNINDYAKAAQAGVNCCILGYFRTPLPERQVLDLLNTAQKQGIKVMFALHHAESMTRLEAFEQSLVDFLTPEVRRHPALIGYFMSDEPLWSGVPSHLLQASYEIYRKVDPYRPVWINAAPRNGIADLRPYAAACDIFGCDVYPVPPEAGHSGLPDKTPSCVGEYAVRMNACGDFRKPIWMTLQGFNWGEAPEASPEAPMQPYPTLAQSRFMALDTLLNGATGYVLWGTIFIKNPEFREELYQVTSELQTLSGVFVHGTRQASLPSTNPVISGSVIRCGEADYFFILNRSGKPAAGELFLNTKEVELPVFADGSRLPVRAGVLSVELAPWQAIVCGETPLPPPVPSPAVPSINR